MTVTIPTGALLALLGDALLTADTDRKTGKSTYGVYLEVTGPDLPGGDPQDGDGRLIAGSTDRIRSTVTWWDRGCLPNPAQRTGEQGELFADIGITDDGGWAALVPLTGVREIRRVFKPKTPEGHSYPVTVTREPLAEGKVRIRVARDDYPGHLAAHLDVIGDMQANFPAADVYRAVKVAEAEAVPTASVQVDTRWLGAINSLDAEVVTLDLGGPDGLILVRAGRTRVLIQSQTMIEAARRDSREYPPVYEDEPVVGPDQPTFPEDDDAAGGQAPQPDPAPDPLAQSGDEGYSGPWPGDPGYDTPESDDSHKIPDPPAGADATVLPFSHGAAAAVGKKSTRRPAAKKTAQTAK